MVSGIVQLINFAHGEIDMIGAFIALIVVSVLSLFGWLQPGNFADCFIRSRPLFLLLRLGLRENRRLRLRDGKR